MQILTVEITNNDVLSVLQELEEKQFIKILLKRNFNSHLFPGKPLTNKEFKAMILKAEHSGSISLKEAKAKWAKKRKLLMKLAEKPY